MGVFQEARRKADAAGQGVPRAGFGMGYPRTPASSWPRSSAQRPAPATRRPWTPASTSSGAVLLGDEGGAGALIRACPCASRSQGHRPRPDGPLEQPQGLYDAIEVVARYDAGATDLRDREQGVVPRRGRAGGRRPRPRPAPHRLPASTSGRCARAQADGYPSTATSTGRSWTTSSGPSATAPCFGRARRLRQPSSWWSRTPGHWFRRLPRGLTPGSRPPDRGEIDSDKSLSKL